MLLHLSLEGAQRTNRLTHFVRFAKGRLAEPAFRELEDRWLTSRPTRRRAVDQRGAHGRCRGARWRGSALPPPHLRAGEVLLGTWAERAGAARCRAERGPRRTAPLSLSTSGSSPHCALHSRSVVSIISSLDITRSSAFIKACRPCRSTSARRSSGNLSRGGSENASASRSLDDGPAFTLASAAPLGASSPESYSG